MRELPKVHVAVVDIPNGDDPESIARTAAAAAMELLVKVSAENRGAVSIDRVAIVNPEALTGDLISNLMAANGRAAVMVAVRVAKIQTEEAN